MPTSAHGKQHHLRADVGIGPNPILYYDSVTIFFAIKKGWDDR